MDNSGVLYCISAPSGAGKTSLVKSLVDSFAQLQVSISHTTRPQRPGEQDGVDYHFVDNASFLALQAQHAFLEHALVFGHHYGTSRLWVEEQLATGTDVLLEIDWQGQATVKQRLPESISIFILPPSLEVLEQRLHQRAQDSPSVIVNRMAKAKSEMQHCLAYDYLIINDKFDQALQELRSIIQCNRLTIAQQTQRHHPLVEQLLA